jgi:hypothetical protein
LLAQLAHGRPLIEGLAALQLSWLPSKQRIEDVVWLCHVAVSAVSAVSVAVGVS